MQGADFTQYENLLLQVSCHYSPGAKTTTLKMLVLQQLPVLSEALWKSFATRVSFYITRNPNPFMPQNQTTPTRKELANHRQKNPYMMWGRPCFAQSTRLFSATCVALMLRAAMREEKNLSKK